MSLPAEFSVDESPPDMIFAYVSPRSQGGVPITEAEVTAATSVEPFYSDGEVASAARRHAEDSGLAITAESRLGFTVAGPAGAYTELTGGSVVAREVLQRTEMGRSRYVTHLDIVGPGQPAGLGVGSVRDDDAIEAVVLERPRSPRAVFPSPLPPTVTKFHLTLPGDVSGLLGAGPAQRDGASGDGVTVAMVDTGQYAHPYFAFHGYRVQAAVAVVPGTNPAKDPVGHGTGESANIFAVAPAATLQPYRASDNNGKLTAAITGFLRAKADHPSVLTNSWGGDLDYPPTGPLPADYRAWALEIMDAVQQGIVVVFSAGNGHFSVEPQVPGVISAGGAFADAGISLQASDYASGYASPWFPGLVVPTVCGLVGLRPRAQYLMLPVPPGCNIDGAESQASAAPPDTPDGTGPGDGWALFSGTSAAAPQIAGAAAVLLGARAGLTPAQVAEALAETATDVQTGHCHPNFNNAAAPGPDLATGPGLANVTAALEYVRAHF
jgi:hypothetical protein